MPDDHTTTPGGVFTNDIELPVLEHSATFVYSDREVVMKSSNKVVPPGGYAQLDGARGRCQAMSFLLKVFDPATRTTRVYVASTDLLEAPPGDLALEASDMGVISKMRRIR